MSDEGTIDKKVSRCSGEKEEGGCGRKRMCVKGSVRLRFDGGRLTCLLVRSPVERKKSGSR